MYSDIFPDSIIAADDEPAFLPVKFQVLGNVTQRCEWKNLALGPKHGIAINNNMGMELAAISQLHMGSDYAIGANLDTGPQFCVWIDDRTRMYVAHRGP